MGADAPHQKDAQSGRRQLPRRRLLAEDVVEVGLVTNSDLEGQHASPDGLISDDSGFETKCPQPATHAKYLSEGRLPPEYKPQVQGSMMVCLDTSASMKGRPETLAKAITLETMRVARLERRACYAFAFSGKTELAEFDLDLNSKGWSPILNFLNSSFLFQLYFRLLFSQSRKV